MNVWRTIFYPLRLLNEAILCWLHNGSWTLRGYERRLIEASAMKLVPTNRAALESQLASKFFVERMHQDRITRIHFHWPDSLEKMDLPEDYRLAKLKLRYGRRSVSVSVEAYKGRIFALQYTKPPKPIVLEKFDIAQIEYGGKGDESIARSIDREEHGDDLNGMH